MPSRPFVQPAIALGIVLAMTALGVIRHGRADGDPSYQLETFRTSDNGLIEGALYSQGNDRVVVLCHGQVFNKESWDELAREFQEAGIDAFAIDFRGYGNSTAARIRALDLDVLGAVKHLTEKGYQQIGILGGSMGGRAVLEALAREMPATVDRVAILAAYGPGIESETAGKLFVVARRDPAYNGVLEVYAKSSGPKELKVFQGSRHAQHLFQSPHGKELTAMLIDFFQS